MIIAVFGGAFDPVHVEHIALIKAVKKELKPDKIILIPTKEPPHKSALVASYYDRAEMLFEAFSKEYEVSYIEDELGGKNYSLNLVKALKKRYPQDELWFIIGSDSLRDLKIWYKPEELCKLVTFAVVPRKDRDDVEESIRFARETYGAKILATKYVGENVSSSLIKGKLILKKDVSQEVPKPALDYIKKHGLYRIFDDKLVNLLQRTGTELYAHLVRTTLFALRFCSILALSFEKVFWASMLHDVKKAVDLEPISGIATAVLHQYYGAECAEREFLVTDADVLNAIRYHTTGRANMSKLEKLIYAADKLEEGRSYAGVDACRALIQEDFDAGFARLVKENYHYLKSQGANIDPFQQECYQQYKGE